MQVSKCCKCPFYHRKTWNSSYQPAGYHRVGMSHAYGFCSKHKQKCLEIKHCEENNGQINNKK